MCEENLNFLFSFLKSCLVGIHNIIFGQLATLAFSMKEIGMSELDVSSSYPQYSAFFDGITTAETEIKYLRF